MSTPAVSVEDVNEPFEVEDDPFPFTAVPDWVTLGVTEDRDLRVYALLRAHVNRKRRDDEAWPSQVTMATVLGLSKPDEIGKSIARLIAMGAVSKRVVPGPRGRITKYRLWLEPRPGTTYDGPRCTADLYQPGVLDRLHEERVVPRRQPNRSRRLSRETAGQRG